ncbi:sulfotransferase 6B1-like [Hyperolius riggenbachi]|uniref:sulfotransferase 6B1-like n=1 Tax=Hyperolius riggenbachi TaxID=752182 RepID=UPI0035A3D3FA
MTDSSQTGHTDRNMLLDMIHSTSKTSSEDLLFTYKGVLYPTVLCNEETFKSLENFEAREDDLLVVTYPKCGTNWIIQILYDIVGVISNKELLLDNTMIEFGNPEMLERFKDRPSPRIISTHLNVQSIPKSFFQKKVKTLLVLRNPKDAAVSFYNFYNSMPALPTYQSWDLFFKDFIQGNVVYGSYFDYLVAWNKHTEEHNVMAVTFEEMKLDLPTQLRKISDFFRLSLSPEQISLVEEQTSFTSMKEKSEATHGKLGNAFFRKGQIGDWRSVFTEPQSKQVDAEFEKYLAGTNLGDLLNYNKYCSF